MMVAPRSVSYDVYLAISGKEPGVAAIVFVFRRLLNRPFATLLLCAAATALALFATAIDPGERAQISRIPDGDRWHPGRGAVRNRLRPMTQSRWPSTWIPALRRP